MTFPQVNAGPLAYAEAFLNPEKISKYPIDQSDRLKSVFRFVLISHCSVEGYNSPGYLLQLLDLILT